MSIKQEDIELAEIHQASSLMWKYRGKVDMAVDGLTYEADGKTHRIEGTVRLRQVKSLAVTPEGLCNGT